MDVPEAERTERVFLTEDLCVIDDHEFFVRGCLEIPIIDSAEPFIWGVWVSLNKEHFSVFQDLLGVSEREQHGPFVGMLCSPPRPYPDSTHLKASVRLRNDGQRPLIEVEPTGHPLAVEQRDGITRERVVEMFELMMHGRRDKGPT